MPLSPDTEHALEACFDAVLEQGLWPERLQRLGESMGARSCCLRATTERHDSRAPRHLNSSGHDGFSALWLSRAEEAPDPHPHGGPDPLSRSDIVCRREVVLFDQHLFRPEDRERMPYFRAVAGAGRRDWWAAASFAVGGEMWMFTLFRAADDGPVPLSQEPVLSDVGQRLSRLVRMAQEARRAADARLLDSLGLLGLPVALLAADGSVLVLTEPAKALLGPDLRVAQRRLATPDPLTTRKLGELAQAAIRPAGAGKTVVLLRDGEPWLMAEGWPLAAWTQARFDGARGAILFRVLAPPALGQGVLIDTFGLTPSEARVAASLMAGLSTTEICRHSNLGRETVRTHLRAVFRKTGVRSQVQLAALLTRLAP